MVIYRDLPKKNAVKEIKKYFIFYASFMNQTGKENLKEFYEKADYIIFDDVKPLSFHIGKESAELRTLLEKNNSDCWGFITAFNPFSQKLSTEENIHRDKLLKKELRDQNLRFIDGVGCDSSGKVWVPEKSVFVFDIDLVTAVNIGRRFEQNAIVFGSRKILPELVWCTPDHRGGNISPSLEKRCFFDSGNLSPEWKKDRFSDIAESSPIITIQILTDIGALCDTVYMRFAETENDPLQFDALTLIHPEPDEFGVIKDEYLRLLKQTLRHYSQSSNTSTLMIISTENDIRIFRDTDNGEFLTSTNSISELPLYAHPKTGIGTFVPLLVEDAPLDMEKSFEVDKDGKIMLSDSWVRYKDVPGLILNYGYPGSDGAIYSIDHSRDFKEWNLYRCRKIQKKGRTFIEIEKTGHNLRADQLNSDIKSVREIYGVLESVNIYLDGGQVIILGLPIHNGNF